MSDPEPTELLHRAMPVCATLGVTAERFEPEEVALSLNWAAELCTSGEVLHGGMLMALADSAAGGCASLTFPKGRQARRRSSRRPTSSEPFATGG